MLGEAVIGTFGEMHPKIKAKFDFGDNPVLGAEFDLDALLPLVPDHQESRPISTYPPVIEDIAIIVDEAIPASSVEKTIREAGGKQLVHVELFDVFRGGQLGEGKKSLAYNLTYQPRIKRDRQGRCQHPAEDHPKTGSGTGCKTEKLNRLGRLSTSISLFIGQELHFQVAACMASGLPLAWDKPYSGISKCLQSRWRQPNSGTSCGWREQRTTGHSPYW